MVTIDTTGKSTIAVEKIMNNLRLKGYNPIIDSDNGVTWFIYY
jgi:hypothetical protein